MNRRTFENMRRLETPEQAAERRYRKLEEPSPKFVEPAWMRDPELLPKRPPTQDKR